MPASVTFRDLVTGFRQLDLDTTKPIIAHTSLSAFGWVQGGAHCVVAAMSSTFDTVIMPVFTYKSMVIPETGPDNNGLTYGEGKNTNRMAEIYYPNMPADRLMGIVPETLRHHPRVNRSLHPILSFAGVNAEMILAAQSYHQPLGPIQRLLEDQGYVLLLGVDHTVNTSIHLAECLEGRKSFVRYALTQHGVRQCPGFPGCSDGFQALAAHLQGVTHTTRVGKAHIQAVPLPYMISIARDLIKNDPLALLCKQPFCERCSAVRAAIIQEPVQ